MDNKRDYYEVLGVSKDSSQDEIKSAYRRLCRKYHPDIAEDKKTAEEKFKEINEAYSVLGDEEKRSNYDQFGHEGINAGAGDFMNGSGDFGFGGLDSIFDIFGRMGGMGGRSSDRNAPRRGSDLRYDLEITLEEAFAGCSKDIDIAVHVTCGTCKGNRTKDGSKPQSCGNCGGSGQVTQVRRSPFGQIMTQVPCPKCGGEGVVIKEYCPSCGGSGKTKKKETITVDIPAGVDNGSRMRIPGKGEGGFRGGENGDLYVFIFVNEHDLFQRAHDDLYKIEQISISQASLGTELNIETLDGDAKLKIPAGTQCDTVFKIKGKGMPSLRGGDRGDLYVKVWVVIPKKLNDKQKKALNDFEEASGKQPAGKKEESFFKKLGRQLRGKLKENLKNAIFGKDDDDEE